MMLNRAIIFDDGLDDGDDYDDGGEERRSKNTFLRFVFFHLKFTLYYLVQFE